MNISTILLVSPMHEELKKIIEKAAPHKTFRFIPEKELTQARII
jgi:glyoxylate/hydroxypyruvate reductase